MRQRQETCWLEMDPTDLNYQRIINALETTHKAAADDAELSITELENGNVFVKVAGMTKSLAAALETRVIKVYDEKEDAARHTFYRANRKIEPEE